MQNGKKRIFSVKTVSEKMKFITALCMSLLLFLGAVLPAQMFAEGDLSEGITSSQNIGVLEIQENPHIIETLNEEIDNGFALENESEAMFDENSLPINAFNANANTDPRMLNFGNVLGNENVTSADVVKLARFIVGNLSDTSVDKRVADVNADGKIDLADVTHLLRLLVGYDINRGPHPNGLTIFPYDDSGKPLHEAEIELFVNNVRTVHNVQSGVISFGNIPDGSTVRVKASAAPDAEYSFLRWEHMHGEAEISAFNAEPEFIMPNGGVMMYAVFEAVIEDDSGEHPLEWCDDSDIFIELEFDPDWTGYNTPIHNIGGPYGVSSIQESELRTFCENNYMTRKSSDMRNFTPELVEKILSRIDDETASNSGFSIFSMENNFEFPAATAKTVDINLNSTDFYTQNLTYHYEPSTINQNIQNIIEHWQPSALSQTHTLRLSGANLPITVSVTSNTCSTNWLTIENLITSPLANTQFTMVAAENTTGRDRQAIITVTHGSVLLSVLVTQSLAAVEWDAPCANGFLGRMPITANASWQIVYASEWIHPFNFSGTGNGIIEMYVEANFENFWSPGIITVRAANGIERSILLWQPDGPALELLLDSGTPTSMPSYTHIGVSANRQWRATSDVGWLRAVPSSGSPAYLGNWHSWVKVEVDANPSSSPREGRLTVSLRDGGAPPQIFKVIQQGSTIRLTLNENSWQAPADGGFSHTINVTSNTSWTVYRDETAQWLGATPVRGNGNGSFRIHAAANPSTAQRTARIVVAAGYIERTITVRQAGASATLMLNRTAWTPTHTAQFITVNVTANGVWNVPTSDVSWLTINNITPTNRNGNGSFRINVTANTGSDAGPGTITITRGNVTQTIRVTQAAATSINAAEWIMYRDSTNNDKFYLTNTATLSLPGFNNTSFGMTRNGNNGRLYAWTQTPGSNWVYVDNLSFASGVGPFSIEDSDEYIGAFSLWTANLLGGSGNRFSFNSPTPQAIPNRDLSDFNNWLRTVEFYRNDGSPFAPIQRNINYRPNAPVSVGTLPPEPTRPGWEFDGWFDTAARTGGTRITATTPIISNRTFYARWVPAISIIYPNPNNSTVINASTDLRVRWNVNPDANISHQIIVRNIAANFSFINTTVQNPNRLTTLDFSVDRSFLSQGHRYSVEIISAVGSGSNAARNSKIVEFAVRPNNPPAPGQLGFHEWTINNGTVRLMAYVTNPATETTELYIASDNVARTVDTQASRIQGERGSLPRIIINAGFMDGSSNLSIGTTYGEEIAIYYNGNFLGRNDPQNRLSTLGQWGIISHFITMFYYSDGTVELDNHGTMRRQDVLNRVNRNDKKLIFAVTGTIPSGTVFNGLTLNRNNPSHSNYFREMPDGDKEFIDATMRSMIGVTASGSVIFLAIDTGRISSTGRGIGGGLSVDAGAEILRSMGATTVLNLDGGGSTQMFCRNFGRVIHPPFDLSDRSNSNSPPVYRPVGSVFLVW
jgi:uncharacterized repeat protein (TIGR02543 family)